MPKFENLQGVELQQALERATEELKASGLHPTCVMTIPDLLEVNFGQQDVASPLEVDNLKIDEAVLGGQIGILNLGDGGIGLLVRKAEFWEFHNPTKGFNGPIVDAMRHRCTGGTFFALKDGQGFGFGFTTDRALATFIKVATQLGNGISAEPIIHVGEALIQALRIEGLPAEMLG